MDADAESTTVDDSGEGVEETVAEESAEAPESAEVEPEMIETVYTVGVTSTTDGQNIACDVDGNAYVLELADTLSNEEAALVVEGNVLDITDTAEAGLEKEVGAYTSVGDRALVKAYTLNVTAVAQASDEALTASVTELYFPAAEEEAAFTVESIEAKTMYAKQSVNVRSGPSSDYEKVGSLSWAEEVAVTGVADTGWYQIGYDGGIAYVSNNYLVETKPEKQVVTSNSTNNNTSSNSTGATDTTGNTNSTNNAGTGSGNTSNGVVYFSAYGDGSSSDNTTSDSGDNNTSTETATTTTGDGGNIEPTLCTDFVGYVNSLRASVRAGNDVGTASERDVEWSDSLAATALERAKEISTNYSHDGRRNCNAEIIQSTYKSSSYEWYENFYNSPTHYSIMVTQGNKIGAAYCEVDGTYYVVVLFDNIF